MSFENVENYDDVVYSSLKLRVIIYYFHVYLAVYVIIFFYKYLILYDYDEISVFWCVNRSLVCFVKSQVKRKKTSISILKSQ